MPAPISRSTTRPRSSTASSSSSRPLAGALRRVRDRRRRQWHAAAGIGRRRWPDPGGTAVASRGRLSINAEASWALLTPFRERLTPWSAPEPGFEFDPVLDLSLQGVAGLRVINLEQRYAFDGFDRVLQPCRFSPYLGVGLEVDWSADAPRLPRSPGLRHHRGLPGDPGGTRPSPSGRTSPSSSPNLGVTLGYRLNDCALQDDDEFNGGLQAHAGVDTPVSEAARIRVGRGRLYRAASASALHGRGGSPDHGRSRGARGSRPSSGGSRSRCRRGPRANGLRIGHFSDLHYGDLMPVERDLSVVELLGAERPDSWRSPGTWSTSPATGRSRSSRRWSGSTRRSARSW